MKRRPSLGSGKEGNRVRRVMKNRGEPSRRRSDYDGLSDEELKKFISRFQRAGSPLPRFLSDAHNRNLKKWKAHNAAKYLVHRARYRAKRRKEEFGITHEDVDVPDECPVCDVSMCVGGDQANSPSIDRIDNDLGYVPGNVVVLCARCNRVKGDSTPEELYRLADFIYAVRKQHRAERGIRE